MRRIKFRAYTKEGKMIYQGIRGDDIYVFSLDFYPDKWVVLEVSLKEIINKGFNAERKMITSNIGNWGGILMQFTGLIDKNGKEIFEGDIYTLDTGETKIQYVLRDIRRMPPSYFSLENELEVIGNIYENSELLGKE